MEYQWDYMIRVYKAKEIEKSSFEKNLQELGKLGWELCSIQQVTAGEKGGPSLTFFFKRPIKQEAQFPSVDPNKVQFLPPRIKPEESAELAAVALRQPTPAKDIATLFPARETARVLSGLEPEKPEAAPLPKSRFQEVLSGALDEEETVLFTLKKSETQGLGLTEKRLILVKQEAWGNAKVISADFLQIKEIDLRKAFGKYDFSFRYFDKKADAERIEVISLDEEHLEAIMALALQIEQEISSIGHTVVIGGILPGKPSSG
ncbi:MAG: PH domain-containing protein [Candidatus Eremiobacteraeota bacterium]|nr:PH domain-containing protein [Candidatus Eremiobacteraeota bacterium]